MTAAPLPTAFSGPSRLREALHDLANQYPFRRTLTIPAGTIVRCDRCGRSAPLHASATAGDPGALSDWEIVYMRTHDDLQPVALWLGYLDNREAIFWTQWWITTSSPCGWQCPNAEGQLWRDEGGIGNDWHGYSALFTQLLEAA